jgi:uncharacterized protein (DUF58 family)
MPRRVVYGEEHSAVRWPLVAFAILGWVLLVGFGVAMNLPHLAGLGVLAIVGGVLALIYTALLWYSLAVGIRVYEDRIQIGGLHDRDRRVRRGTWPPRKLSAGSRRAVFTCPWQGADGVYLITERSEIKRMRREVREYRKSTHATKIPLGVFDGAASFANALLVISVDPRRAESEPREFGYARGQYGRIMPVRSPTWLVPIRHPGALRDALERLPQAPPVYGHLPSKGSMRFEVS